MDAMKHIRVTLLSIFVAALLAACKVDVPEISAASVTRYSADAPAASTPLSAEQRAALTSWFKQHRSGWSTSHATYAPVLEASLTHENGAASVVNVLRSKVVVYGSFGQYERRTNKQSIAALRRALGATTN
jgi:hypothetical protein